jgi:nicotinamide riboside kinase
MRLAITGAHGTGKTTLGRHLAERFDLVELPTPGRTMASRGLPVNERATVTSQTVAWLIQLRLEATTKAWIANRTLLDIWAYAALSAERSPPAGLECELLAEMESVVRAVWPDRYDIVFYTPPRIPLVADAVRSADPVFQTAADEKIRKALETWGLEHVVIDVTSRSDLSAAETLVGTFSRKTDC